MLTQEVSYESLLVHQRKSLHEAVGRAFERHHPERLEEEAVLLARHYSRAEAWREAVHYGRSAADRASRLSQFAEAFGTLEQVLQWLPHLPDNEESRLLRAGLDVPAGTRVRDDGPSRPPAKNHPAAHGAPGCCGAVRPARGGVLREGDVLTLLKRFNAADRALSTALRISRDLENASLQRNILRSIGLLRWHEGRNEEALALTEHALAIDRQGDDEDAVAGDLVNLASILKSMGDYPGSLARSEEALAMPSMAQNPKKLAYALHTRANVHRAMGNLDATLSTLRLADQNSAHLLPVQRSFHLTSIAHIELQKGEIDSAIATYRQAIELSRRARHAEGLAQALRTLGEVLFELGRHEEALPCLAEAAGLFARLEDATAEAAMWTRAAAARERVGLHAESLDAWNRVHVLARQAGDSDGQDALEGNTRALRHVHGATDVSVAAFAAALDFASTQGEWGRAIACRNTLGILEWTRGRFADALGHYEAALVLSRELADPKQEGLILNSLGVTLSKMNRPDEARTVLEESVALNHRAGQPLLEAHAAAALGHISRTLGRYQPAAEQFRRSLELRRAAGDRAGEAWMWRRIAETHVALGSLADAQAAAETAARVAATSGDADVIAACAAALPVGELSKGDDAPLSD